MGLLAAKRDIVQQLQKEVLSLQQSKKPVVDKPLNIGLGELLSAFPNKTFPTGTVHEFISPNIEYAAATNGFICGLLDQLMLQKGPCLWISTRRTIYPPALKLFGIDPERIIFIDLERPKQVLWAIEEGLKCEDISVVIGELSELGFTESRRLQLAVESSNVTGFIHRYQPRSENTVACTTRWMIKPVSSITGDMPGVGFPRWEVQLVKVRNGKPGSWQFEWRGGQFHSIAPQRFSIIKNQRLKTG
ncbi:ImuA family protein [Polluticoccus soli]|uniref:ImuA family protein n=1 Tax=Polluticoccus soli TaxID=3034150 RepID=UPI0023E259F9|nr:Error-prone repair protein ImuA [Flavipsychrobacter sp. JY13-12]